MTAPVVAALIKLASATAVLVVSEIVTVSLPNPEIPVA